MTRLSCGRVSEGRKLSLGEPNLPSRERKGEGFREISKVVGEDEYRSLSMAPFVSPKVKSLKGKISAERVKSFVEDKVLAERNQKD